MNEKMQTELLQCVLDFSDIVINLSKNPTTDEVSSNMQKLMRKVITLSDIAIKLCKTFDHNLQQEMLRCTLNDLHGWWLCLDPGHKVDLEKEFRSMQPNWWHFLWRKYSKTGFVDLNG